MIFIIFTALLTVCMLCISLFLFFKTIRYLKVTSKAAGRSDKMLKQVALKVGIKLIVNVISTLAYNIVNILEYKYPNLPACVYITIYVCPLSTLVNNFVLSLPSKIKKLNITNLFVKS